MIYPNEDLVLHFSFEGSFQITRVFRAHIEYRSQQRFLRRGDDEYFYLPLLYNHLFPVGLLLDAG